MLLRELLRVGRPRFVAHPNHSITHSALWDGETLWWYGMKPGYHAKLRQMPCTLEVVQGVKWIGAAEEKLNEREKLRLIGLRREVFDESRQLVRRGFLGDIVRSGELKMIRRLDCPAEYTWIGHVLQGHRGLVVRACRETIFDQEWAFHSSAQDTAPPMNDISS